MNSLSLLTIVKGRHQQLANLIRGVQAQRTPPQELIVVFMNEAPHEQLPDPGCKLTLLRHDDPEHALPLAAARNRAAAAATQPVLAFLDVDCIPDPDYLWQLQRAVSSTRSLIMGEVRYLPEEAKLPEDGRPLDYTMLEKRALAHPRRPILAEGADLQSLPYHLFWSLAFGLRRDDFARLEGFDEKYVGYGGEDTDFAFTARKVQLSFFACPARAYHQYHPSYRPPYNHLEDIVVNARRFYEKWQIWPMEGWLTEFARAGYVRWENSTLELIRLPDESTIIAARSESPYG